MSGIGQRFPGYHLTGVVSSEQQTAFRDFTHESFPGKWQVVFFWPKDFTFVCPTEIAAFGRLDRSSRRAMRSCSASASTASTCTSPGGMKSRS